MNKKILIAALLAITCAALWAADPVVGYWISYDDKSGLATAGWEVYEKGGILYGEILAIVDKPSTEIAVMCKGPYKDFPVPGDTSKMTVCNTPWIYNLTQKKEGVWAGGNIVDPNDGKFYGCEITFRPADGKKYKSDTLEMRGKIGPFGRSQFWLRSTKDEVLTLYKGN